MARLQFARMGTTIITLTHALRTASTGLAGS